jgi:hypothetical protein
MFKILVSGSREIPETGINVLTLSFSLLTIARAEGGIANIEVISGGARGADEIARRAANKVSCKFTEIKADWGKHGRAAGPIRNGLMLDLKPDIVWAFPLGKSIGTRDCIKQARQRGIHVEIADTKKYFEVENE